MTTNDPPLSVEDLARIIVELSLGSKPTVLGPAADAMRERLAPQIEELKRRGIPIRIPEEWPGVE